MARQIADIEIGQKINRLTLREKFYKNGIRYGSFDCECGNTKETTIWFVYKEKTRSCGCLKKEIDRQKIIERCTTHGMSDTVEHNTWMGIKARCYNVKNTEYKSYGGRGIRMSEEWLSSFETFYNDLGPKPDDSYHIGRKDHFDHYCRENCRWIDTKEESVDNDNNRFLLAFNKIKTLLHWIKDKKCKCNIDILKYRLYTLGWSPEKSITTVVYEG